MTQFASGTFTGSNGTELSVADGNWSKFRTCDNGTIQSNRLVGVGAAPPSYKHSATPPSADYEVSADFYMAGTSSSYNAGVCARIVDGALTCYWARYKYGTGWQLYRYNSATPTQLGSTYAETIASGATRRIRLRVEGNNVSVYRDAESSPIITVTDGSPLSSAGYAGVLLSNSTTDGPHLDNFSADTLAAPDTTPPVITGPSGATGSTSSTSIAENTTAVHTFSADETVTWDLNGGADVSLFTINSSTGALAFLSAPDYESPADADTNNVYVVGVRATDTATNATTQTVSVTVTDIGEGGNVSPVWDTNAADMSTKRGQALTPQDLSALVSDADMDTLTFSISGEPTGVSVDSGTGFVSGTPTAAPGVYTVTPTIDDGVNSPVDGATFDITVVQCVLALSGAGYEFGDGSDPATMAVLASTSINVAAYPLAEWPPASAIATVTASTDAAGNLADLGDDDLSFGTTYRVLARNPADGETFAWTMAAT
jgi:hypothetical protein